MGTFLVIPSQIEQKLQLAASAFQIHRRTSFADRASKQRIPGNLGLDRRLKAELLARGVYTRVLSDIICLAPPLTTTDAELEQIASAAAGAIHATFDRPYDPSREF